MSFNPERNPTDNALPLNCPMNNIFLVFGQYWQFLVNRFCSQNPELKLFKIALKMAEWKKLRGKPETP